MKEFATLVNIVTIKQNEKLPLDNMLRSYMKAFGILVNTVTIKQQKKFPLGDMLRIGTLVITVIINIKLKVIFIITFSLSMKVFYLLVNIVNIKH